MAKPDLSRILILNSRDSRAELISALSDYFNVKIISDKRLVEKELLNNQFAALIFFGSFDRFESFVSELQTEICVIAAVGKDDLQLPPHLNGIKINTDGLSSEAFVELVKLRVENFEIKRDLRETFDRLSSVGRVTNDILWDWDLRSGFLYYNSAGWTKIIGKDVHEGKITFESWLDFVHPEDRTFVRDEFNRIIKDKHLQTFEVDYRMISKSGFSYVTERGYAERDENGIALRLLGSTQDVTERKLAGEELKKLSAVVRETVYGVFITDVECRITWVNKAFTDLTGYTLDEVKGKAPFHFLFYTENGPEDSNTFEQKILKADPFEQELALRMKSSSPVWVRINCQPQQDIRNNPSGFFAIIADVTAQKTAEKKLMQNEKKFRVLIENIQDGLALIDANGSLLEFFSGEKILGFTVEDYRSSLAKEYVHPDYREAVSCALRNALQYPGKPSRVEFKAKRKDGDETWIETTFYNLLDEDPLYAVLANFRDTRESKLAEELLKQSEKKYRNLFNNNPLAMFVWDPATLTILEANEAASVQYGYGADELKRMTLRDLIHPDMEERMNAVARSSIGNSKFRTSYLTRHIDKEGRVMHMEVAFHPIDYFGNRASMAIVKNITDQVELERRLEKERQLKQQEITLAAVTAQEQERLHIGRELHDNINQILATVRLYIEQRELSNIYEENTSFLAQLIDFVI
ncbi:MAG: PAS domain S-box protein, partial [Chitinophagaceae bacterium]